MTDNARDETLAERIAQIEARLAAATPGEWRSDEDTPFNRQPRVESRDGFLIGVIGNSPIERQETWDADAAFIAHAKQDIPFLLASLRAAPPATDDRNERDMLQLIDERDAAQEAVSDIYYMMTGRSPEWSNNFGFKECLEELTEARQLLGDAAKTRAPDTGMRQALDNEEGVGARRLYGDVNSNRTNDRAALSRPPQVADTREGELQPIVSAPKDGRNVILYREDNDDWVIAFWGTITSRGEGRTGWHTLDSMRPHTADWFSHWAPVPDLPPALASGVDEKGGEK